MKTVMIVDDSRIMRNIVKNTFELLKIPCRYLEAGDGNEAINQLSSHKVDLILLDWNMPNLSGIDFLKKVRAMDAYLNIPIVMVTSEAAKLNVIEAVKAGVTAYLTKPINDKIFMEKISKIAF
ncbi:response regulator [Spirochaetia bacterium]|nr:response regulator [Spirochaetia bacterium]